MGQSVGNKKKLLNNSPKCLCDIGIVSFKLQPFKQVCSGISQCV